jgi:hypothetical protein
MTTSHAAIISFVNIIKEDFYSTKTARKNNIAAHLTPKLVAVLQVLGFLNKTGRLQPRIISRVSLTWDFRERLLVRALHLSFYLYLWNELLPKQH